MSKIIFEKREENGPIWEIITDYDPDKPNTVCISRAGVNEIYLDLEETRQIAGKLIDWMIEKYSQDLLTKKAKTKGMSTKQNTRCTKVPQK